jgi:hypothetical protein
MIFGCDFAEGVWGCFGPLVQHLDLGDDEPVLGHHSLCDGKDNLLSDDAGGTTKLQKMFPVPETVVTAPVLEVAVSVHVLGAPLQYVADAGCSVMPYLPSGLWDQTRMNLTILPASRVMVTATGVAGATLKPLMYALDPGHPPLLVSTMTAGGDPPEVVMFVTIVPTIRPVRASPVRGSQMALLGQRRQVSAPPLA